MAWELDCRLTLIDFAVTCTSVYRDKYEWTNNESNQIVVVNYYYVFGSQSREGATRPIAGFFLFW